jgi:hypothetical protein
MAAALNFRFQIPDFKNSNIPKISDLRLEFEIFEI